MGADAVLRYYTATMDSAAEELVRQYDALPQPARQEVLAEVLRRTAAAPHDLPSPTPTLPVKNGIAR